MPATVVESSTAAAERFFPPTWNYPSPLKGYENLPPLPEEKGEDGMSIKNVQTGVLSKAYEEFVEPLNRGPRGAFDVHIYHFQSSPEQTKYAKELYERIRREFPELRIFRFWDVPIGPHPVAMFEVDIHSPAQFGAFVAWLAIWRGPLSVLVHPNTIAPPGEAQIDSERKDHTTRGIWMGERIPLDSDIFIKMGQNSMAAQEARVAANVEKASEVDEGKK